MHNPTNMDSHMQMLSYSTVAEWDYDDIRTLSDRYADDAVVFIADQPNARVIVINAPLDQLQQEPLLPCNFSDQQTCASNLASLVRADTTTPEQLERAATCFLNTTSAIKTWREAGAPAPIFVFIALHHDWVRSRVMDWGVKFIHPELALLVIGELLDANQANTSRIHAIDTEEPVL